MNCLSFQKYFLFLLASVWWLKVYCNFYFLNFLDLFLRRAHITSLHFFYKSNSSFHIQGKKSSHNLYRINLLQKSKEKPYRVMKPYLTTTLPERQWSADCRASLWSNLNEVFVTLTVSLYRIRGRYMGLYRIGIATESMTQNWRERNLLLSAIVIFSK